MNIAIVAILTSLGLISASCTDLNSTLFLLWFWSRFNLHKSVVRLQTSSLSPSSSQCLSSGHLSQGLSQTAIKGFWMLNQWPSSSTVLGSHFSTFRVGDSRCWQQPALFRNYHSCNNSSVQQSRGFWWFVIFGCDNDCFFLGKISSILLECVTDQSFFICL